MKVKLREHVLCRHYDLVMDKEADKRHRHLIREAFDLFPNAHHLRGGQSGPLTKGFKVVPGKFHHTFRLDETIADWYEKEMGISEACQLERYTHSDAKVESDG